MRNHVVKLPESCDSSCAQWPTCAKKASCPVRQRTLEKKSFGKSRKIFPSDEELAKMVEEEMSK